MDEESPITTERITKRRKHKTKMIWSKCIRRNTVSYTPFYETITIR